MTDQEFYILDLVSRVVDDDARNSAVLGPDVADQHILGSLLTGDNGLGPGRAY